MFVWKSFICKCLTSFFPIILLIFLSLNLFAGAHSDFENIRFEHLTPEDGLAQIIVGTIIQDSRGFLWFGTRGGLNRYDGYTFKLYESDQENPHSLSSNSVYCLYEDHLGNLWVGTANGLNKYDQKTDRFTVYSYDPDEPGSLGGNIVWSVFEDHAGTMWVGTHDGGLSKFDREKNNFIRCQHDPADPASLSSNHVETIFEDKLGVLWIGTANGLNKLTSINNGKAKFTCFRHNPDDPGSLSGNHIRSIHEDFTGTLWIGTRYNGLNKFDREAKRFTRYRHNPKNPYSLGQGPVWTIYEDREKVLWIGTYGGGLNRFDRENNRFIRYVHDPTNPHSLCGNWVEAICEDNLGTLWVGTWDNGVSKFDRKASKFRLYTHNPNNPNSLSGSFVRSICEDPEAPGRVFWVGTDSGLNRFDKVTHTWTHFRHDPNDSMSLSSDSVTPIYADSKGLLWIGTIDGGLNMFNPKTGKFTIYKHDLNNPNSLSNNHVRSIAKYPEGVLWIGTSKGLNKFEIKKKKFTRYHHDPTDPKSLGSGFCLIIHADKSGTLWIGHRGGGLSRFDPQTETFSHYLHEPDNHNGINDNDVWSIYEDSTGILWLGTSRGLNKFDPKTGTFVHYQKKDGLSSDAIGSILEDDRDFLWIGTRGGGLSRFDPKTETFKNYDSKDGLQSNEIPENPVCKSKTGELFFGGLKGMNSFYPEEITDSTFIPPVVLTDFKIFNKSVLIGAKKSPLKQHINETEHIKLTHKESVISFEFAALNYRSSRKNQYAYIMENFEGKWNLVDHTRRFASYTNLPPGEYVFRVKASNNDGIWNETGKSVKITVLPPWWQTLWFRVFGLIILSMLILGVYKTRTYRLRKRSKELQEINTALNKEISERQRAQEALQESEEKLRSTISSMDDLVFVLDRNGIFLSYYQPSKQSHLYVPPELFIGKSFKEVQLPPGVVTSFEKAINKVKASGKVQHVDYSLELAGKKTWYSANVSMRKDSSGMFDGVTIVARDITRRKQAEEEILFKNTILETQKESSIDGILVVDDKGKVISYNKRFAEMWNIPDQLIDTKDDKKLLGYVLSQLEKPGEFIKKVEYLYTHKNEKSRDEILFKDGRAFDRFSAPLNSSSGEYFGRIWFFRDITDMKAMQEKLVRQEKLAILGELAGGVAHELRNPLGAIKNSVYFLGMTLEDCEAEVKESLQILDKEIENSERIISSLLDYARARPPSKKRINIKEIIQAAISRLNVPENIEVDNRITDSIPEIMADPHQLDQVFGNIFLNSIQAMPEGGQLVIHCETQKPDWLSISITDTGVGIPAENIAKIFEPLFTSKAKGIGLGMAISKTYVEGHGGSIAVRSEEGKGTTLTIKLPINTK